MSGSGQAPYARIVADLRRRIVAGELSPGQRVPSTRELTREWGVAMATATKALTTLRHEGLVRPVRGVGTVVADAAPRDPAPGATQRRREAPGTMREQIVAAAIAIADTEGLASVSMRRVAADIGVATMSLYRHVADKDALLLEMIDTALGDGVIPAGAPPDSSGEGWRARLELGCRALWATFRRHPWLAPAVSLTRPQPIAHGMAYTEWMLASLDGLGLDLPVVFDAYLTLFNYVRGTAINLALEADAAADSGLTSDEWLDTQHASLRSVIASGQFPLLERVIAADVDADLDTLFESGVRFLLDGLATVVEQGPGRIPTHTRPPSTR
ncbi:MAG: TetR/AcrR family transcriptional regulator C-terminal domain-containing protein [Streptosporangiaceae bacterium]